MRTQYIGQRIGNSRKKISVKEKPRADSVRLFVTFEKGGGAEGSEYQSERTVQRGGIQRGSALGRCLLENDIQSCEPVQKLSALKTQIEDGESPILRQIFAWLFPFGPGWNAILGTFYISSVPNLILAFIPAQINPETLNTMTAFATGGLLSDVFLHLVPHSFMGEHQDDGVHFVMVEEKKNILVGLGIFIGFASFFFMEKTLRVLAGEDASGGHSHSHSHSPSNSDTNGHASGVSTSEKQNGLRSRAKGEKEDSLEKIDVSPTTTNSGPSKLSAYLNLFGDFVHNITDGLAYGVCVRATTTLACFAHEIPHEIADYSILVRSGFTKKQAMQSQFLTAVGAFIAIDLAAGVRQDAAGILGTTTHIGDLVIPFVAGGFLYIGAVAVLPTLLEDSKSGKQAIREPFRNPPPTEFSLITSGSVPKGGWEPSDGELQAAALREALEEGLTLCPSIRLPTS
ncbi:hypothetical protein EYR38_007576 [Pleurotus pulmonarius]|nr:hypothetical protein EYR38_007576 [Pleurotus pulmonarius]